MAENEKTEIKDTGDVSEASLGDAGKKALAAERAARKEAEKALAELQAWKADRELADARAEIAAEHKLTPAMQDALVGSNREELEAHAGKLKAVIPPARGRPQEKLPEGIQEKLIGGASNPDDEAPDYSQIAERIDN